jgi:hypothetical protein
VEHGRSSVGDVTFFGLGEYFEGDVPSLGIDAILGLERDELKPFTGRILEADPDSSLGGIREQLALMLRAYSQFQDLLDISIQEDDPFWHRHFCYYESAIYLREALRSLLEGNVLAALSLMRPFQELSVYHLYWYRRCRGDSYAPFYAWLENGRGKPPFKNALQAIFNELPSAALLRPTRIKLLYDALYALYKSSCSYVHTPTIEESVVTIGHGMREPTQHAFFFAAHSIELRVRQLCFAYVLVYPMSLFPVAASEKWGYGGPLGLFTSIPNFLILEKYLGADNAKRLGASLRPHPDVESLLYWYDAQRPLSESEIEASWEHLVSRSQVKDPPTDRRARLAFAQAQNRAFGWTVNYLRPQQKDEDDDELVERITKQLESW